MEEKSTADNGLQIDYLLQAFIKHMYKQRVIYDWRQCNQ